MSVVTVARSVVGQKGCGWKANVPDERDRVYRAPMMRRVRAGKVFRSALAGGLEPAVIFNQGGTGSCVAQSIAGAIATREMFLSRQLGRGTLRSDLFAAATYGHLSRRALYSLARATHGEHKIDGGTYIRAALRIMRRHGCPLETAFAWSELKINATVPGDIIFGGKVFADLEYESIVAVGDDKLSQIRDALEEGFPVVFGTQVTRSFQQHRGSGVYAPRADEPSVGGHAMYIANIEPDGDCWIVNSWGRGWGDEGRALVRADWVKSSFRDLTIIRNWQRAQAAEKELAHA